MHMNAATNGALRILMACRRDRSLSMSEMAAGLGLASALVTKSCHELMSAGYLEGRRGRHGGYRLARPAEAITVMEIVDLFEPKENLFPCRLRTDGECRIVAICRLRRACETAHAAFRRELETLRLSDLVLPVFGA